jgi:hypothetical protein
LVSLFCFGEAVVVWSSCVNDQGDVGQRKDWVDVVSMLGFNDLILGQGLANGQ